MAQNYQKMLDEVLEKNSALGVKPRLLLHACCAPCSSYVLEYLSCHFDITLYFYNPNISSYEEFLLRESELRRFVKEFPAATAKIKTVEYDHGEFLNAVHGKEGEREGGERCFSCYALRLEKTAEAAKEGGFDLFTTTLSISPHKNAEKLNEIGRKLSERYGIGYLYSDFKKKNGYKRSCELSKEYNLYRQSFCGCEFSKRESEKRIKI